MKWLINIAICSLLIVCVFKTGYAKTNVKLEYEEDRKMKTSGNIVQIQSEGDYQNQKIIILEKQYNEIQEKCQGMQLAIDDINKKIEQIKKQFAVIATNSAQQR